MNNWIKLYDDIYVNMDLVLFIEPSRSVDGEPTLILNTVGGVSTVNVQNVEKVREWLERNSYA